MAVKTIRTSEGLRSTLFDTLDKFLNSEIDVAQAKTVAKLADSLLKSIAVDLEYKRLIQDIGLRNSGPQAVIDMKLNILMAPSPDAEIIEVVPADGANPLTPSM